MKPVKPPAITLLLGIVLALAGCSSTPTTMGTGQKIVLKSMLPHPGDSEPDAESSD